MTFGYGLIYQLLEVLNIKDVAFEDGIMRFRRRQGAQPFAESEARAMFKYDAVRVSGDIRPRIRASDRSTAKVTWLSDTFRRDDFPVPGDVAHASTMALALAQSAGAFGVYSTPAGHHSFTHYALMDFRLRKPLKPAATRDKLMRRQTRYTLFGLSDHIVKSVQRDGSAAAAYLSADVALRAAYLRTCCTLVALGDELSADIERLAADLDALALRAAIPTDEPLRVAAELSALWQDK